MKIIAKTKKDTVNLGKKIAANLTGGDILLLKGDLGAGKTTFTKGIAQYFGIKKEITSPTFALMNVYPIKSSEADSPLVKFNRVKTLVHIDTYRLKNEQELLDIGAEDYLGEKNTICVIEWPEKIMSLLKNKKTTAIILSYTNKKTNERNIRY